MGMGGAPPRERAGGDYHRGHRGEWERGETPCKVSESLKSRTTTPREIAERDVCRGRPRETPEVSTTLVSMPVNDLVND